MLQIDKVAFNNKKSSLMRILELERFTKKAKLNRFSLPVNVIRKSEVYIFATFNISDNKIDIDLDLTKTGRKTDTTYPYLSLTVKTYDYIVSNNNRSNRSRKAQDNFIKEHIYDELDRLKEIVVNPETHQTWYDSRVISNLKLTHEQTGLFTFSSDVFDDLNLYKDLIDQAKTIEETYIFFSYSKDYAADILFEYNPFINQIRWKKDIPGLESNIDEVRDARKTIKILNERREKSFKDCKMILPIYHYYGDTKIYNRITDLYEKSKLEDISDEEFDKFKKEAASFLKRSLRPKFKKAYDLFENFSN